MWDQIQNGSLDAIGALLAFFYDLPVVGGSYGLAIMLLTFAVMVVLMPLTLKATRSTIKMTMLQPELRALQKEYKDDRQQLNQEMMALYQRNGVNPVGGCLPMIAQLPVFLLLFNVLRGITRRVTDLPYYGLATRAQELNGATIPASDGETFAPDHLAATSQLAQDLSQETEMAFGPFDLAAVAGDVLRNDIIGFIPYALLIAFLVASSYYQQRQISARRGAVPDNPTPQQQTQQQLLRILPLFSGVSSFFFPAGLVLYWATSNVFRIGQQAYITQALYSEDGDGTKALEAQAKAKDDDDAKPTSKSGSSGSSGADGSNGSKPAKGGSTSGSKKAAGSSSGSSGGSNGSKPEDRNEAWARRRAAQAERRPKAAKKPSSSGGSSSRVTPKGTQPTASKRKRKR